MQIVFVLLALFAIGCVLYGISAGVQIIVRGFSRLAAGTRRTNAQAEQAPVPLPPASRKATAEPIHASPQQCMPATPQEQRPQPQTPEPSPIQYSINELRAIFALYQRGALTREEFEVIKQRLLFTITASELSQPRTGKSQ